MTGFKSREIKFRAWNKYSKKMVEPDYISCDGDCYDRSLEPYDGLETVTDEYTLMQFTGLKDENGKEIYEGDIVHTPAKTDNIWEIYWHLNGFCLGRKRKDKSVLDWPTDENGYVCYGRSWVDIEVIGNIYENPELIEQKEGISNDRT